MKKMFGKLVQNLSADGFISIIIFMREDFYPVILDVAMLIMVSQCLI